MELPTPHQIKSQYPLTVPKSIRAFRETAKAILQRKDPRLAAIVGPCSIHDPASAYEYALRLKQLSQEIGGSFFPIMRLFIEKPRTQLGWKGMLYDPHLDSSYDIATGIRTSRELILKIAELGIPCATELLEPLIVPYLEDLIVWGVIGARTSASQPHRQMASGLAFPVGFKNDCRGDIDVAIAGIGAARTSHSHIGINEEGHIAAFKTEGNPLTHLILRGSEEEPNYDPASVKRALNRLQKEGLEGTVVIDCSHGNSGKDHRRQHTAFLSVIEQAEENRGIAGLMLESHLFSGKQSLSDPLDYGVSITDSCIGWEETAELLVRATSMSSVQN